MNDFNFKDPKNLIALFVVLFVLIAIPLTVISLRNSRDQRSQAASTTTLYVQPASQNVNVNGNLTVQVRENSGTTQIVGAEITVNYDATKLDYVSTNAASTSDFQTDIVAAPATASGSIYFVRGVAQTGTTCTTPPNCGTTVTGDKLIATINFKAKTVAGSTPITFAAGSAVQGRNGNETINPTTGGTVTVVDPLPTVTLNAPAAGAFVKGNAVAISATATDNLGVTKVEFYDGATLIGSPDTTSPYSVNWDSTVATAGNHTLMAKAYDANCTTSTCPTSTVTVTVDNTAPTAPVISGLAAKVQNSITVSATSTDTNLDHIEFQVGTGTIVPDTTSPYQYPLDTKTLPNGTNTMKVTAFDKAGTASTITQQTFVVDNQAPTAFTVSGTANGQNSVNLTWTASTDALSAPVSYDVYRNSVKVNTTTISGTTYSDTGLTGGQSYSYFIQAKDSMPTANTVNSNTISVQTQAPPKPGDYDGNGSVGLGDLNVLVNTWASTTDLRADGDLSSKIDLGDLSVLVNFWGT